ncbi:maleylpyruvate isomerase family mycothiol-dependent enzyme [Amycolatopsis sp. 195334CR]|uniref:maleylpyruvate isomerase family mycothiol-dependent enzyme n=1 Tax=Amycolatopsis sp. 195334CR TaxID=2814588 RepID=UPI001A8F1716|nr:maleylpyruvate isomerase family mycothiol-dependent enzyme [Amycolatopsis sp. 195334CR]MBN6033691.1 maleylpyruvate isomerase family mycothiol-dependent enzyme [Amycolatopsis sp. 195334CR]
MSTSAFLTTVADQTRTLAGWVDGQDPAAPVPTCPKWTLADLVDHVGSTQRMVAMLVGGRMTEPSQAFAGYVPAPEDPAQWGAWLNACAAEAAQAFESANDDTPVWDPSGAEAGVPFWSRRLLGEICVHRADAASALGRPYELAPEPAAAAVEDWLDTMTSHGYWENKPDYAAAMRGTGQTLHFHTTDTPGEWVARREPDTIVLERTHTKADVALRGTAEELLLVLSRRRPLAEATTLEVLGDQALLDHWIENMDWTTD